MCWIGDVATGTALGCCTWFSAEMLSGFRKMPSDQLAAGGCWGDAPEARGRVNSGGGSALSVPGWNHSRSSGRAGWLRWFSLLSWDLKRDPSPVKPTSCSLYGTQKEMSCFSCGLSQTYLALGSHYECFHVLLLVIKRKKTVKKKKVIKGKPNN